MTPQTEGRVLNPSYAGAAPSHQAHAAATAAAAAAAASSPFRGNNSPRPDGRPPLDNRMPSPKSAYPQHQPGPLYSHQQDIAQGAPENGPPPPPSLADNVPHRAEEGPGSAGPKRMREWEDEPAAKKQANEENRARLDDMRHRRASTPPREREFRRNSSEIRRQEDQRRAEEQKRQDDTRHASDNYHPSEAAHHPPTHSVAPQIHTAPPAPPPAAASDKSHGAATPKEERPPTAEQPAPSRPPPATNAEPERAARKMDVDEDYDDSGEDDKKAAAITNGSAPGASSAEAKTSTPTSAGVNGNSSAPALKAE